MSLVWMYEITFQIYYDFSSNGKHGDKNRSVTYLQSNLYRV